MMDVEMELTEQCHYKPLVAICSNGNARLSIFIGEILTFSTVSFLNFPKPFPSLFCFFYAVFFHEVSNQNFGIFNTSRQIDFVHGWNIFVARYICHVYNFELCVLVVVRVERQEQAKRFAPKFKSCYKVFANSKGLVLEADFCFYLFV